MKTFLRSATLIAALLPSVSFAQAWSHAAAPMGQFEGGIEMGNGASVGYSCAGFYSTLYAAVPGSHLEMVTLVVDGRDIARLELEPDGMNSGFEWKVNDDSGRPHIVSFNQTLFSLAEGSELVLKTDANEILQRIPLKGSSNIKACVYTVPR